MIKAIIFDCFGVVIADGLEAIILQREQSDPAFRKFVMEIIHESNRGLIDPAEAHRKIAAHLGIDADDWRQQIFAGETRNTKVIDLIKKLRKDYQTALLSNVGRGSLRHRFSDEELSELFDDVVVSADVGLAKPEPEIYELSAKRLGVRPAECVFIDDRQTHVVGAQKVGMQAILYQNFAQFQTELGAILANSKS